MTIFFKKAVSFFTALCLVFSLMGTVTLAAGREYAAKAYINDTLVGFENAPYEQDGIIYVPMKEACRYMNITLANTDDTYTLTHGRDSVTFKIGNMIVEKDGQSLILSAQSWNKGGVIYVPTEIFSKGLEMFLTVRHLHILKAHQLKATPHVLPLQHTDSTERIIFRTPLL